MISINYTIIISLLNFVLLIIVLNKLLYKPIKQFLTERQEKIADDMDAAKVSREEAQKLVEKKDEELKIFSEEIRKMKTAAEKDAEKKAEEILKNAKEIEKKMLQNTESQLAQEKKKAMSEIETEITTLVVDLSAKFLSGKLDEKDDKKLIEKLLSEGNKK